MHREAGGLVDHDQMLVLEQDVQRHRFRLEIGQRLRWRHPQLHLIALAQGGFGFAGLAVHPHIAGINEFLDPGPALLGALTHQPAVQPHRQRLGINEGQQFTLPLTEGRAEGLLRQRGSLPGGAHSGSSRAMLPRADLRKSSNRRWAIRAVSPEVWRCAAASSQ